MSDELSDRRCFFFDDDEHRCMKRALRGESYCPEHLKIRYPEEKK